jgi:hypothetical protein
VEVEQDKAEHRCTRLERQSHVACGFWVFLRTAMDLGLGMELGMETEMEVEIEIGMGMGMGMETALLQAFIIMIIDSANCTLLVFPAFITTSCCCFCRCSCRCHSRCEAKLEAGFLSLSLSGPSAIVPGFVLVLVLVLSFVVAEWSLFPIISLSPQRARSDTDLMEKVLIRHQHDRQVECRCPFQLQRLLYQSVSQRGSASACSIMGIS